MRLQQVAKWRESALDVATQRGIKVDFKLTAIYSKPHNGFVVFVTVDGKGDVFVSSQRQDKRVFKTLDALRRAVKEVGITWFEVVG